MNLAVRNLMNRIKIKYSIVLVACIDDISNDFAA